MKSAVCREKIAINRKKGSFHQKIGLRNKPVNCYISSTTLYGVEKWTFLKLDPKYGVGFKTWCWRRMEKNSWTDRVRNEEVLQLEGEKYSSYSKKKEC